MKYNTVASLYLTNTYFPLGLAQIGVSNNEP